jgi:hypothetical protein
MEVMMLGTRSIAIGLLSFAALAACHDDDTIVSPSGTATARVANATAIPVDVASGAPIATGDANIGFGASSSCLTTDVFEPTLTVSPTGTTNSFALFPPNLRAGQSYVGVDFPTFAGAPEFAALNTTLLPPSGQAGVRVFNAAAGSGAFDVYVTTPGTALGTVSATGIGFRTVSGLIPVTAGSPILISLTTAGTQTVVLSSGNQTFTAGQNAVLVIAPPAAGTTTLRTFLVFGC